MKIIDKLISFLGLEEGGIQEQERDEDVAIERVNTRKVVSLHTGNQVKVLIVEPETFEDAKNICDNIKSRKAVIMNVQSMDKEQARRLLDFLGGALYALDGRFVKISNGIFILASNNVDISQINKEELKNKLFFRKSGTISED